MLAASLMLAVGMMVWARQRKIGKICSEVIIDTSSDKTTMESIVEAQQNLKKAHEYIKTANIIILRLWAIALARSPKVPLQLIRSCGWLIPLPVWLLGYCVLCLLFCHETNVKLVSNISPCSVLFALCSTQRR